MDAIDRKILAYVQKGGRDSYAEIGAAVGLSISAVNERLKNFILAARSNSGPPPSIRGRSAGRSWPTPRC